MHSKTRTALLLLAGAITVAGCGGKATGSVGTGTDAGLSPNVLAAVPDVAVDEIDSLLAGFDETLAELDQLLNQAAAALAAEEMEILP